MILILAVATFAFGFLVGAATLRHYLTDLSQTARDDRRYRDAVALARDLTLTPDALDLRDRARRIVEQHDAATTTSANRKDI